MSEKTDECKSPESNTSDVQIKEEPKENDIKDYAENTMNELLGWYGYDKVDSTDTENLNLEKYTSGEKEQQLSPTDELSHDDSIDSDDNISENSDISKRSRSDSQNSLAAQHRNLVTALTKKHRLSGAPEGTLPAEKIVCSWCQNSGPKLFTLKTSSGNKAFCSEVCFTLCRRASFKKNKVCDWCKHVRHTVNYVDFQDGEQQLQFCSAKCLNQYKMSIFCRETQEHLKQIRSPSDTKKPKAENDEQILITPELWLKDGKLGKSEKSIKQSTQDKDSNFKNRIPKTEKLEVEGLGREKSMTQSKSYDRIQRDRNKRNQPKDTRITSSTPNGIPDNHPNNAQQCPSSMAQGNMPAISQLIPSQLWNMFAPGMPQLGGMPPWFYPGLMPHLNGFMPPGFPFEALQRNPNENGLQNMHQLPISPVNSECPSLDEQDTKKDKSPTPGRLKSSVRPISNLELPTRKPSLERHERINDRNNQGNIQQGHMMQQGHGIPPVTMIMPVPVALPFPVPIPLPLPLSMDKIMEVFNKKRSMEKTEIDKSHKKEPNNLNNSYSSDGLDSSIASSGYRHILPKVKSDINENETIPAGRLSCNSCITENSTSPNSLSDRSSPRYETHLSTSYDFSVMRKRCLSPDGSLDLTKRTKITQDNDLSSVSYDGAIDLSKDSNIGKTKCFFGKENRDTNDASSGISEPDLSNEESKEPKIHIVSPRDDPPLSQQLPLPPVDHKYSNRRGLILDAPFNPRKSRSPSPERRPYIARDYRGERSRRGLLRIRNIKTK